MLETPIVAVPSEAGHGKASGPPFPLPKVTAAPWREQALTKVAEQRFVLTWVMEQPGVVVPEPVVNTIRDQWDAVTATALRRSKHGASVERVIGQLDAIDTHLLRMAPASYVYGQLPRLLTQLRRTLHPDDVRITCLEAIVQRPDDPGAPPPLSARERDMVVAAHHAVTLAARREVTRLRDFKRMLLVTAIVLALGAAGLAVFAFADPAKLPMCFSPGTSIVCTTSTTTIEGAQNVQSVPGQPAAIPPATVDDAMRKAAAPWDVPLVELVGLLAGAVAAAASLRKIRGSSTPFGLPIALALLKLPTGALTAAFGILLMQGDFIPGLSALDSSGQIIAWAILLGYAQQLLTRFVDQRAQTVLDNFSRTPAEKQQAEAAIGTGAVPAG